MKIEHIALYVEDLEGARNFFIKYLGAKSNEGYHNPQTDFRSYFLSFEDGARLEIMQRPEMVNLPKEAARIWLKATDVRVERLQEITETQAQAEGCNSGLLTGPCTARGQFENLWNSTIKKPDADKYGWSANPWVWVIELSLIHI